MGEFDVTQQRSEYIGGSDVSSIMGISAFKSRFRLLLEKAGLSESTFGGNEFTEYGNVLEPQIRDYVNSTMPEGKHFEPNRVIQGDLRAHSDGFNGECILEIKTTSHLFETVDGYTHYLVQLLLYMMMNNVAKGKLAVYARPEDFDPVFDPTRLTVYEIDKEDYLGLCERIWVEIDRFRADLERLKENPLLCEEDFIPSELTVLSDKVVAFEAQMAQYKAIEKEYKVAKKALFEAMQEYDVKSWRTINGVKVTRVDAKDETTETVEEFDLEAFKAEHPDIYEQYLVEREKKTAKRSGFVKITFPKEDGDV